MSPRHGQDFVVKRFDDVLQLAGIGDGLDFAAARDGDDAAFLGDHQAEGVAQLGQAQRRGVARAHSRKPIQVAGQWQVTAQLGNAVAFDDDGAVVSGRVRIKDALEQGLAESGVDVLAAVEVAGDHVVAADDNERSDAGPGEVAERADEAVDLGPGEARGRA